MNGCSSDSEGRIFVSFSVERKPVHLLVKLCPSSHPFAVPIENEILTIREQILSLGSNGLRRWKIPNVQNMKHNSILKLKHLL